MSLFIRSRCLIQFRSHISRRRSRPHGDFLFMFSNINIKPTVVTSTDGCEQEGQFSLIHIPLALYSSLLQPILQVLLPDGGPTHQSGPEGLLEGHSLDHKHYFLNISVTPIECSI